MVRISCRIIRPSCVGGDVKVTSGKKHLRTTMLFLSAVVVVIWNPDSEINDKATHTRFCGRDAW